MVDSTKRAGLTRREALILSSAAGVGVAAANFAAASDSIKTGAHQGPGNLTTPRSAIAKSQSGKVRGYLDGGVFTFKGIPYGQTTAGENRWLPAKPPTPWTDEYPALIYGANCPQTLHSPTLILHAAWWMWTRASRSSKCCDMPASPWKRASRRGQHGFPLMPRDRWQSTIVDWLVTNGWQSPRVN